MITINDWVQWVLDGLVAAGTLGVTVLAYVELRTLNAERRETKFRELADRVLVPMRRLYEIWTDTTQFPRHWPTTGDHAAQGPRLWKGLRQQAPYIVARLSPAIAADLDSGNHLMEQIDRTHPHASKLVDDELKTRGNTDLLKEPGRRDDVTLRLFHGDSFLGYANLLDIWASGQTLPTWAARRDAEFGEPGPWEIQVLVGGQKRASTKEAEKLFGQVVEVLETDEPSRRYAEAYRGLLKLAPRIRQRIDTELQEPPTAA